MTAANGSAVTPELIDVAGVLAAHELLEPAELMLLRQLSTWLYQVRAAFGLRTGGVGGLWAAIVAGGSVGHRVANGPGSDTLFRLRCTGPSAGPSAGFG